MNRDLGIHPQPRISMKIAYFLSDTTHLVRANLYVIPGSHRHGYSDYPDVPDAGEAVFHLEIDPDQVDETGAVDLVLEPNQLSIHDVRLIHGSRASTSSECRMLFVVRYIPARVPYNRQQGESFPTFLARGSDAGGGHDDGPMKAWLGDFD